MADRFKSGDASVEDGMRRIALDQIGKAEAKQTSGLAFLTRRLAVEQSNRRGRWLAKAACCAAC